MHGGDLGRVQRPMHYNNYAIDTAEAMRGLTSAFVIVTQVLLFHVCRNKIDANGRISGNFGVNTFVAPDGSEN